MTVRELSEWLQTFQDQEAEVYVVVHKSGHGYNDQGGNASDEPFDPEEHTDYTDLRGNPLITPDKPYFNARTLLLGVLNG